MRAMLSAIACALGLAPATEPVPAEPAAAVVPAAATITRDELLAALRAVPGVHARYREEQHIALLAAPLVSEGTMHFAPPDRLAKHQRKPARARTVVAGGRLRFADAFGHDEVDLASNPVVALFVHSVLHVLAGDVARIEATWAVGFSGGADGEPRAWVLALRPITSPATELVESIVLRGREARVERIEVRELGGDRTVTTLSDIDTAHRYEGDELTRVFSVDAGE